MKWFVVSLLLLPLALAELEMVALVFRHGQRTPAVGYPNDPHKDFDYGGLGLGALTEEGKTQLYNQGILMYDQYWPMLKTETFSPANLLTKSSSLERCVQSGISFLAGFSSAAKNWKPSPLQILPNDKDYQISVTNCPRLYSLYRRLQRNPPEDVAQMLRSMDPIIETFRQNSGFKEIRDFEIGSILDTIENQKRWGLELPSWFNKEWMEALKKYKPRAFALLTETQEMKRLYSGALITEILDNMNNISNPSRTPVRFLVYSGQDFTVNGLVRSLGIEDQVPAVHDFAATVAIELYKTGPMLEVKITYYHYGEDASDEIDIRIPNCTKPCSLEQFNKNMEYFIVRNPEELCAL